VFLKRKGEVVSKANLNAPATGDFNAKDAEVFAEERKGFLSRPLRKTLRSLRLINRSWSLNLFAVGCLALGSALPASAQRKPTEATRPVVVMPAQSLDDLKEKLKPGNKTEELIDSAGMELRVAIQHENDKTGAAAELHDASDDVYYVLEGSATLVLGGKLDTPKEVEPGEWRSPKIIDGKTFEITKGDLVVVPRGTPHQRSTANKDFTMILIKIYAEPLKPGSPKPTSLSQKP
jgi:mannose-6-phosphate isomerase-like protein (cupin superfamily)